MRESKECVECGGIYFRPESYTGEQWEMRKYCSVVCAGRGGARARRERKEKSEESERAAEVGQEDLPAEPPPADSGPPSEVKRRLRVVRVGPNPRLIVCEYYELAQRRLCTVMVKRNTKFVRGMNFEMVEPRSEAAFVRPWIYEGPPPRRRGRW